MFSKIWKLDGTTVITVTFFYAFYGKTVCFIKLSWQLHENVNLVIVSYFNLKKKE